jgi:hypothetical protein
MTDCLLESTGNFLQKNFPMVNHGGKTWNTIFQSLRRLNEYLVSPNFPDSFFPKCEDCLSASGVQKRIN